MASSQTGRTALWKEADAVPQYYAKERRELALRRHDMCGQGMPKSPIFCSHASSPRKQIERVQEQEGTDEPSLLLELCKPYIEVRMPKLKTTLFLGCIVQSELNLEINVGVRNIDY